MRFDVRWAVTMVLVLGCGRPTLGTPLDVPERTTHLRDACAFIDVLAAENGMLRALLREETASKTWVTHHTLSSGVWSRDASTEIGFRVGSYFRDTAGAEILVAASGMHGEAQTLRHFDGSAWHELVFDVDLPRETHQLWLTDPLLLSGNRMLVTVNAHPPTGGGRDQFRSYLRDASGTWTAVGDWQSLREMLVASADRELHRRTVTTAGRTVTQTTHAWSGTAWTLVGTESVDLPEGLPLLWPHRDSHGRYILGSRVTLDGAFTRIHAEVDGAWTSYPEFLVPELMRSQLLRDPAGGFVVVRWTEWSAGISVHRSSGLAWKELATYTNVDKVAPDAQALFAKGSLFVGWTEMEPFRAFELPKDCEVHVEQVQL